MTLITIGGDMGEGGDLSNLMAQGRVATRTFDFVVGDMFLMHELRGIFRTQEDRFIMTFHTLSLRDMAISLNHTEVALLTGYPSCDILSVIEVPTLDLDIPFGLDMTGGAPSDRTGNALFFPFRTGLVIVTDKAVDFVNREM
jgi:hypothetical protein